MTAPGDATGPPRLAARGIVKDFPGVRALDQVDFTIHAGEVHALLGENGAGKSTLTRIIAGDYAPDAGELSVDGRPVRFSSPRDALAVGVRLVTQERALVPTLSVAENVLLGRLPSRRGRVDWRRTRAEAATALARVGLEVDPAVDLERLRPAEQQLVEVAKATADEGRVLIVDEATAALPAREADRLLSVIRNLRGHGVAVIYITHRVGELSRVADRVTVLRDGRRVWTGPLAETSREELVDLMVGRRLADLYPRARPQPGAVRLSVRDVTAPGVCDGVSFDVRAGEILAIYGLVGSGATEIPYVVAGDIRSEGEITAEGRMALVPADRRSESLLYASTVRRNIGAATLTRHRRGPLYSRAGEHAAATRQATALNLRPPDPGARVATLSGGNQQKAVLGRWLERGAATLLLSEPTRGVDVGARSEIYAILGELCAAGKSVVLASSDLDEVVGLADRILVIAGGRVSALLTGDAVRHDTALEAATR